MASGFGIVLCQARACISEILLTLNVCGASRFQDGCQRIKHHIFIQIWKGGRIVLDVYVQESKNFHTPPQQFLTFSLIRTESYDHPCLQERLGNWRT